MMRPKSQFGLSLPFSLVMLVAFSSLVAAGWYFDAAGKMLGRASDTAHQFERISAGLAGYVSQNRRLPCPANPAAFDGLEVRDGGGENCTFPDGILPWRTMGLVETQALDGWARHFSYRVYDGADGLVRDDGLNMAECDTDNSPGTNKVLPANSLCDASHNVLADHYLAGKGLTIQENGINRPALMAFVLISHGTTGYGAYLPGVNGGRMPLPTQGIGDDEYQNTLATGTYHLNTATPGLAPNVVTHFDDQLRFISISELARAAAVMARDWSGDGPVKFNAQTTADLTTYGTDHFLSTGTTGSTAFRRYISGGQYGVEFGIQSGTSYAGCLWWPQTFTLVSSSVTRTLRIAFRFSADSDGAGINPGFVVGLLPGKTTINNSLCGDGTSSANIGWTGGSLPVEDRFGVEVDMRGQAAALDPAGTHLALDYVGTTHNGTLAADCSVAGKCDAQPFDDWLRDGLSNFHTIRVEVVPNSINCGGTAPEVETWLVSESFCDSQESVCTDMLDTATGFTTFPAPQNSESLHIKGCVPAPVDPAAYNELYFGFTTRNSFASDPGVNLRLQELSAGVY